MTGGHDVGDIFCGTEDARAPARGSERAVHGWLCRLTQTRRIPCCHRGTLSARGGPPRPFSAKSRRNTGQHRFIGLLPAFASLPLPTVERGKAQPPHLVWRQALPRLPGANRCLSMHRDAGDSVCRPGTRRRLPTVVAEASRCRRTYRQTVFGATELLLALGDNPTRWNAEGGRA